AENVWLVTVLRCRLTVLGTGETICHAGTARLPRRHGTSAAPAWHVCHAGVANIKMPYTRENARNLIIIFFVIFIDFQCDKFVYLIDY
ncbi:MAG: hypothetical protein PUF07_02225, partial [Bacteroidales bacterium]|nr:hypothetical protein [Bacteroidales bacterium]